MAVTLVLSTVLVTALATSAVKWLRVIQREHYLPGSAITMYRIWATTSPVNRILAGVPPVCLIVAATLEMADIDIVAPIAMISAVAVAVFPVGLSLRGRTSKLVWTLRLRRLALVVAAVCLAAVLIPIALAVTPAVSALIVFAAFPLLLEVGVRFSSPLEHRLSQRFVDDATATLTRVAPTIVAITGSYAKTSTKTYVQHLVEGTMRIVASPASFNNRLGLARSVNEHLTDDTEVFVAEMGAYGPGEIADLCGWIHPQIAVMTAIGPVHLERFKTEANIVAAKSEILVGVRSAVFNVDHPPLRALADQTGGVRIWRCGTGDDASDVRVTRSSMGLDIEVRGRSIGDVAAGGIFAANLACAVAVALELGISENEIVERAKKLRPPAHRQTISSSDAGFTIIDDTFNSNPSGAASALGVLASQGGPQARRVLVTPGMVELGPRQFEENEKMAAAASMIVDDVVVVGRTNRAALRKGTAAGTASVIVVATRHEAVEWVRTRLGQGDVVLYENDLPDHYP